MDHISPEFLLKLYQDMLSARLVEEHMLRSLRKGTISKWFSGIGQEAISVGATAALHPEEWVLTVHRNLGTFITKQVPLSRLFSQFLGRASGFTKGRDRTFHFGTHEYKIVGMISHLAAHLGVADGLGLSHLLRGHKKVVLAFTGEGSTSEGDFHEALNIAAVWKLPVIFVIENNGYALSTPVSDQYACASLADKAVGYGITGESIDGNCAQTVYQTINRLAENIRNGGGPALVECRTFRIRGHEEASGVDYVPKNLIEEWKKRDPLNITFAQLDPTVWSEAEDQQWRRSTASEIEHAFELALADSEPVCDAAREEGEVFSENYTPLAEVHPENCQELRFVDAIKDAQQVAMKNWGDLVLMGQDVAEYGGVFKATEGLVEEFGRDRVRNTPLCESAVLAAALGLAIENQRSIVELQFSDFVSCGFNQIVNNLSTAHYRWGQSANVTIRMPCGGGVGAGPFHSQTTEAWFMHVPGLKVVYPSNPFEAKGLLLSAINDPNPVLFFEHKGLYRKMKGPVPAGMYGVPLGVANVVRQGGGLTIVTYGMGVHWVGQILDRHKTLDVEVIDLRSLVPMDTDTVFSSVKKTGRALVVSEGHMVCGPAAEIAALISQHCFQFLDAPVTRFGPLDTPVPFATALERGYVPLQRLEKILLDLYQY